MEIDLYREYFNALRKELRAKHGIDFPSINHGAIEDAHVLEEFVNMNHLFNVEPIWEKYRHKIEILA